MANVSGVVRNSSAKPFNGRQGPITLYSFQIEGDNRYFRCGTDQPNAVNGQSVEFEVTQKGDNFNVNVSTIKALESQPVQAAPAATNSGYPSKNAMFNAKDGYWERKEQRDVEVIEPRITHAAARRDAVTIVTAALAADALSFGNVQKGKKLDMLVDFVQQVTATLVAEVEGGD